MDNNYAELAKKSSLAIKKKVREAIQKNDGWIKISGIAVTRRVYVEDIHLISDSGDLAFNWGYVGEEPTLLAKELLKVTLGANFLFMLPNIKPIITSFPDDSFMLLFNIKDWLNAVALSIPTQLNSLMKIRIDDFLNNDGEPLYVSKFIDFPNMNIRQAKCSEGTYEADEILAMSDELFEEYKAYLNRSNMIRFGGPSHILITRKNGIVLLENGPGKLYSQGTAIN